MFKKGIFELHLKDKLFFLLVAVFAIGGLGFAVKKGVDYLGRHNNDNVKTLNEKYGDQVIETLNRCSAAADKFDFLISQYGNAWVGVYGLFAGGVGIAVSLCFLCLAGAAVIVKTFW